MTLLLAYNTVARMLDFTAPENEPPQETLRRLLRKAEPDEGDFIERLSMLVSVSHFCDEILYNEEK